MKNKIILGGIILVVILLLIIAIIFMGSDKDKVNENFIEIQIDGTKVNTSNKLNETKIIDNLEINNIRLIESSNLSQFTADVKNPTSDILGNFGVSIILLDKNNEEIISLDGNIPQIEPGQTAQLNVSITKDVVNAYDVKIIKK